MKLKILNRFGNCKWQFEVCSLKEAQDLFDLHCKTQDTGYLHIESSMKLPMEKPKEKKPIVSRAIGVSHIVKAENGRILSRRERERLGYAETKEIYPTKISMAYKCNSENS